MKILNGRELSGFIKERQSHVVNDFKKTPTLLIIRDNDNPVIAKYIHLKKTYGEDIGINVIEYQAKSTADIESKIKEANQNQSITAIILQLPIKEKEKTEYLTNLIAPEKDVDGLSNNSHFDSATATAILWLLAGYDISLDNQKIALVGRGKLVGAPLERMLKASNREVTVFTKGNDLTKLNQYDIIISATGVPGLISDSMIKPGAVLVDAGTASENGVIKGDTSDEVRARKDLRAITPLTGGVGPLTVTCLFEHVIKAAIKAEALKN
jgi:methylenetetrahydrofolate dehydrogenase (NADP+)/methenyltetrahydrofolate cyclohydrolase